MIIVKPIPVIQDNYVWLIRQNDDQTIIVDPGDARPVLKAIKEEGLKPTAILVTHDHWDHVDGIESLLHHYPVPIYGRGRIPHLTHPVQEGDHVHIGEVSLEVLEVPGHTADHVAYHGHGMLFCGDTLFAAGCGRVGTTPGELFHSLEKLKKLPTNSMVYCTHEYTLANLKFALTVEPDNHRTQARLTRCRELRLQGLPTLPDTLEEELATNPFLRGAEAAVIAAAEHQAGRRLQGEEEVFTTLRRWKNNFS